MAINVLNAEGSGTEMAEFKQPLIPPPPMCYLAASLLFEGPGNERCVSLDDCHILYPPALWQLRVRGDLDQLQAHFLPQGSSQATELPLGFGQVHRHLPVLTIISHHFPKSLWDAPHHGVGESAIWAHICHDFNERMSV